MIKPFVLLLHYHIVQTSILINFLLPLIIIIFQFSKTLHVNVNKMSNQLFQAIFSQHLLEVVTLVTQEPKLTSIEFHQVKLYPLNFAIQHSSTNIVEFLAKYTYDVNQVTSVGETAMDKAIMCMRPECMKILFNHGANPFLCSKYAIQMLFGGAPYIIKAAMQISLYPDQDAIVIEMIQVLLNAGSIINSGHRLPNQIQALSALDIAMSTQHFTLTKFLLDNGAETGLGSVNLKKMIGITDFSDEFNQLLRSYPKLKFLV